MSGRGCNLESGGGYMGEQWEVGYHVRLPACLPSMLVGFIGELTACHSMGICVMSLLMNESCLLWLFHKEGTDC